MLVRQHPCSGCATTVVGTTGRAGRVQQAGRRAGSAPPRAADRGGAILGRVSESPDPQEPERQRAPLPRIGDAERDRAVDALQVHMAEGRLDREEFDERLDRALGARTAADLQPLFADLPEPRPETGLGASSAYVPPPWAQAAPATAAVPAVVPEPALPATRPRPLGATLAVTLIWPAAVLFCLATTWQNWWVWIVAAMVAGVVNKTWPGPDSSADESGSRRQHGGH